MRVKQKQNDGSNPALTSDSVMRTLKTKKPWISPSGQSKAQIRTKLNVFNYNERDFHLPIHSPHPECGF